MERRLNEVDWTPTELSQRAEEFQTGLLEKDRIIQSLETEVEQQVQILVIVREKIRMRVFPWTRINAYGEQSP